jgi:hypothetical protein
VSPTTVWSRRWPALGRVVSCGAVPAADRPTRRLPGGASGRCPGRRASPWSGRPKCPPYRPLPVLVNIGYPPGPVPHPVRCPAVRCPAVRCPTVGCPVAWFHRPGPACPAVWCRPSGVQPSGVRPSVLWRPSRPGSARRSPWDHAGPAGPCTAGVGRVPGGLPRARAARRRLRRLGRKRRCGGRGSTEGSVPLAGHGPGPGCARLRRRPRSAADRPGRPAWPGVAHRRRLTWSRTRDYSSWSLSSLTPKWTRLEGQ